ncbi:MAG: hypothetical protein HQK77_14720 [Desulfobacterales bacterium]|nr:hypothetical protein [Desulfobacterales bacterium]
MKITRTLMLICAVCLMSIGVAYADYAITQELTLTDTQNGTLTTGIQGRIGFDKADISGSMTYSDFHIDIFGMEYGPIQGEIAYTIQWDAATGYFSLTGNGQITAIIEGVSYPLTIEDIEISKADQNAKPVLTGQVIIARFLRLDVSMFPPGLVERLFFTPFSGVLKLFAGL